MPSDGAAAERGPAFEPRERLHPASWLFVALHGLKQLVFALVVALVVGSGRNAGWWVPLVVIVPVLVASIWHQWVYRYGFSERGLVIHQGLLTRNVRTIDYERIENVDIERGLLHRLLGVANVRIETSSGGKPEAMIRVLTLRAVEAMREHIFAGRSGVASADDPLHSAAPAAEATLLELPPAELVRFGLADNRGMLVVAAVLGVLQQIGFFENLDERLPRLAKWLPWERLMGIGVVGQALLVLAAAVVLIAGTRALSVLLALVTLHDFRLTRRGDDLQARFGLLTTVSVTLRRRRIQAVHQTASWLHRAFGRVSLRVDLAGDAGPGSGGAESGGRSVQREHWLAPVCSPPQARQLIHAALPQARLEGLEWRGLAPRARRRIFRIQAGLWLVAASVLALWVVGPGATAAVVVLAPLPLFWLHATLYVRYTGWALDEDLFVLRRGWLTRKLSIAPRNRIQSVRVTESPFDRRQGMAGLEVDNAGAGSVSHRLALRYLPRQDAAWLADALYHSALR